MDKLKKYIFEQLSANRLTSAEAGDLLKELNQMHAERKEAEPGERDIAIIGLAAEIGQAENVDQFWQMLRTGQDGIRPLPAARLANVEEYLKVMGLTWADVLQREGAYLNTIDQFDPEFFKISLGEAALMDPNQRRFLEIAYKAIEDAGYGGDKLAGTNTGLFLGYAHDFGDNYKRLIKDYAPGLLPMATLGNINSVIAGRISYLLDLHGMSLLVDTACSSALVAVHLACQSIRNGDCAMALAGGVKMWLIPAEPKEGGEFGGDSGPGIGIEAQDGRCRTFDQHATGAGFGEGTVALLLKPLKKALADRDAIYAVIKGTASNQDGKSIGISAPNVQAQEDVIKQAWKDAKIPPETITYIEAHGTGTRLGDPIEIFGMQNAFANFTKKKHFCGVGSVKTNVGHLDNAAGIAGLLKVILALKYRELPPSLHFEEPNSQINFADSPVYVNDRLTPWTVESGPRRAGVSSFGLSGTNCHVVLEEAQEESGQVTGGAISTQSGRVATTGKLAGTNQAIGSQPAAANQAIGSQPAAINQAIGSQLATTNPATVGISALAPCLFVLSARSENSLQKLLESYCAYLRQNPEVNLADLCYTASTGRGHYNLRVAVIARNVGELHARLQELVQAKSFAHGGASAGVDAGELRRSTASQATGPAKFEAGATTNALVNLRELAQQYLAGEEIDWNKHYRGQVLRRLHLPTYEFDHKKCWVKPTRYATPAKSEAALKPETTGHYFECRWEIEPLKIGQVLPTPTLLLGQPGSLLAELTKRLRAEGHQVITATAGNAYRQIAEDQYEIGGTAEDYLRLFKEPALQKVKRVLHLLTYGRGTETATPEALKAAQSAGLFSLSYLTQALQVNKLPEVEVVLISDYANAVTGREMRLHPENASFFGLGKVVRQEYANIHCRCIDLEDCLGGVTSLQDTNGAAYTTGLHNLADGDLTVVSDNAAPAAKAALQQILDTLLAELKTSTPAYIVAYREGQRYIEQFTQARPFSKPAAPLTLREEGVYLITGGTGGIGLAIASYLAHQGKIRLALLGRTVLPARDTWAEVITSTHDQRLAKKLKALQKLEAACTSVDYYSVNLANYAQMHEVIADLHQRYGQINGIIHAAGVPGNGILLKKELQAFSEVIAPKIEGTWNLDHLTRGDQLDFFVLFSSVSGIFGGPGQSDYTAANSYLDGYAAYLRKAGIRATAINWTAWAETGMAYDHGVKMDHLIFQPLPTVAAIEKFAEVLAADRTNILVGAINYPRFSELVPQLPIRLSRELAMALTTQDLASREASAAAQSDVRVKENVGDVEKRVAAIWASILGLTEVSVDTNFFDLGGDSIIALTLINELKKEFPNTIEVTDLFSRPTIRGTAELIQAQLMAAANPVTGTTGDELVVPEALGQIAATQAEKVADDDEQLLAILDQLEKGGLSFEEGLEMINDLEEEK